MKYGQIVLEIKTGDVFLFRNARSLCSRLIRWRTQSVYSHVGVALWVKVDSLEKLCIIEAVNVQGVRMFPMELYLRQCQREGCAVDWFALTDVGVNRDRVAAYCLSHWGSPYASLWQMGSSFGWVTRWLNRMLGRPMDTNPDAFFCSELVASAFRFGGYRPDGPDDRPPVLTHPGSIALYPILQRRGTVEIS